MLIVIIVIFERSFVRFRHIRSTTCMYICQQHKIWSLRRFFTIRNSFLSSRTVWVLWTAVTFILCLPVTSNMPPRNRKGFVSQNCLFAYSFDLTFVYTLTGWEGSATDARIYEDARTTDLIIPESKYYLADAGYPLSDQLLVPYRRVRYHLAEWGRANVRYSIFSFVFTYSLITFTCLPTNKN